MTTIKYSGERIKTLAMAYAVDDRPNYGAIAEMAAAVTSVPIKPSRTSIKAYADGENIPGGVMLYILAKVLRCRMEDFFVEEETDVTGKD